LSFSTEDFLKALDQQSFDFQKGTVVYGRVFSHANDGAYVDIGGKAAAFLPMKETILKIDESLEEALPVNTEREFLIVRDQDANGQVTLSIRKLELQQIWERLIDRQTNQEVVEVVVTGTNKGGVTVDVEGLRGFIPRSHLVGAQEDLEPWVDQVLRVAFLEVNPETKKLVMSQRIAARSSAMSQLSEGQLVDGIVAAFKPFGAFIDFDGVRGLLHISQITQGYMSSVNDVFEIGQAIKAVVVQIDDSKQRVGLSTKVLEKYPGEILKECATVMAEAEERAQNTAKIMAQRDE
jgi:small subunit ribosomal protein S1